MREEEPRQAYLSPRVTESFCHTGSGAEGWFKRAFAIWNMELAVYSVILSVSECKNFPLDQL